MRFEKVSEMQYLQDCKSDTYYFASQKQRDVRVKIQDEPSDIYADIKIPVRATKKSAGYDFFAPYDIQLAPGDTIKLATGIRVLLDDDKFLMCVPRSGLGFKARVQLDNTVGIIDADYSDSMNEGHIHVKLTNDSRTNKTVTIHRGEGMLQAIILSYHTVEDDNTDTQRDGGFGSTTKKRTKKKENSDEQEA